MTTDRHPQHADASFQTLTRLGGAQDTRVRILEALADVIVTDGVAAFSVQAVADRAGVAHRTVYRHFPSREALLEGLTEHLDEWMRAEGLPGIPSSFEQLLEAVPLVYDFFEAHAPMIEAMVVVSLALGVEPGRRRQRTEGFVDLVLRQAPNLGAEEARRWAIALRSLASSQQWYTLRQRYQMHGPDAIAVTDRLLRGLIADVRRHNARLASKGGKP